MCPLGIFMVIVMVLLIIGIVSYVTVNMAGTKVAYCLQGTLITRVRITSEVKEFNNEAAPRLYSSYVDAHRAMLRRKHRD
jgi:hypothetical protein